MLRLLQLLLLSQKSLILWLLPIALLGAGWLVINREAIQDYFQERERRNRLDSEVRALREELDDFEHRRGVLEHGGFEKEKVARERLQYVRPGEEVLILEDPETEAAPTSPSLEQRLEALREERRRRQEPQEGP